MRTIYGLLAENMSPNNYGFDISRTKLLKNTIKFILWRYDDPMINKLWIDIQDKFKQTQIYKHPFYTVWIYFYNFNKPDSYLKRVLRKLFKIAVSAKKIIHK